MLNQMLFVWVYLFNIFTVLYFWNERLFPFIDLKGVVSNMALPHYLVGILSTMPISWCMFAVGLTPFLVGAIWCRHNPFYLKMTRDSILVKIMWGFFLIQSVMIAIDEFAPFSVGSGKSHIWSGTIAVMVMFFLWGLFYILHSRATIHVARRRKESHEEWRSRIGAETVKEIAYAQMPAVSSLISIFVLLVLATI